MKIYATQGITTPDEILGDNATAHQLRESLSKLVMQQGAMGLIRYGAGFKRSQLVAWAEGTLGNDPAPPAPDETGMSPQTWMEE